MRRLLEWLSLRLRIDPISHDGVLILKRYYVATLFGYWRVYLHHFVNDDPDELHNHPWRWGLGVLLAGFYYEETRYEARGRVAWWNVVNGDKFHRVVLAHKGIGHYISADDYSVEKVTAWSLFIHSPRKAEWAFLRPVTYMGQRSPKYYSYDIVHAKEEITPFSDWYLTAQTGREWEAANTNH